MPENLVTIANHAYVDYTEVEEFESRRLMMSTSIYMLPVLSMLLKNMVLGMMGLA